MATLGDRGDPSKDEVRVDGLEVNLDPNVKYFALHKPAGVVTTMHDPQGRPDIRAYLPAGGPRVFPVGRLDRDTEGLLLLMNDGDLANGLTHPRFGVEEYLAEVEGLPTRNTSGCCDVAWNWTTVTQAQRTRGSPVVRATGAVRVVMTEGRKREVRRLLAAAGLPVVRLVRVRVGPVRLGALGPGERRELTLDEVVALRQVVDG